jgi:hypothetical protein
LKRNYTWGTRKKCVNSASSKSAAHLILLFCSTLRLKILHGHIRPGKPTWCSDGIWAGLSGLNSRQSQVFSPSPQRPDRLFGPLRLLTKGTGALSLWSKHQEREASSRTLKLYLNFPICLHGVVFNFIFKHNRRKIIPITCSKGTEENIISLRR